MIFTHGQLRHVHFGLSNVMLCEHYFVYSKKNLKKGSKEKLWFIPEVPHTRERPKGRQGLERCCLEAGIPLPVPLTFPLTSVGLFYSPSVAQKPQRGQSWKMQPPLIPPQSLNGHLVIPRSTPQSVLC